MEHGYPDCDCDLEGGDPDCKIQPPYKTVEQRYADLKKLVEAVDYLQHCRRRQVQMEPYGFTTTKKSVERASDQYDYLRGQVKL